MSKNMEIDSKLFEANWTLELDPTFQNGSPKYEVSFAFQFLISPINIFLQNVAM